MTHKAKPPTVTERQKRFVAEYLVDLSAKEAAIRAGYSTRAAKQEGCRLLAKPHISEAIAEAMRSRLARVEVTQDDVIRELKRIAFGDIREVLQWTKSSVQLRPSKLLTDDQAAMVAEVAETPYGLRLKTHDKARALELLGKHQGMFVDRHEHRVGPAGLDWSALLRAPPKAINDAP